MRFKIVLFSLFIGSFYLSIAASDKSKTVPEKGVNLFNDSIVHEIRISFPQEFWKDSLLRNRHIKDSTYVSKYLQCNATIDGKPMYACGIRYKGESSYQFYPGDKKSFRLKFNAFIKKQRYDGVKGVSLNNNFKDPSMMREKLILDYCKKNRLTGQRSSFVKVYINNTYFGLYTMLENINGDFLKRNYGTKKGHFVQGKPRASFKDLGNDTLEYKRSYTYKNMDKTVREMMKLIHSISSGENLENYVDVQEMYKQFIVSNFFMNIDAYNMYFRHNFFLFKPKKQDLFHWINYDYNYSFGAWSPDLDLKKMESMSPYFVRRPGDFPLWELVLSNKTYKKEYTEAYQKMLSEFDVSEFEKSVRHYHRLLSEAVELDTMKMYSTEKFNTNITRAIGDVKDPGAFSPGLIEFITNRKAYLETFFKD